MSGLEGLSLSTGQDLSQRRAEDFFEILIYRDRFLYEHIFLHGRCFVRKTCDVQVGASRSPEASLDVRLVHIRD